MKPFEIRFNEVPTSNLLQDLRSVFTKHDIVLVFENLDKSKRIRITKTGDLIRLESAFSVDGRLMTDCFEVMHSDQEVKIYKALAFFQFYSGDNKIQSFFNNGVMDRHSLTHASCAMFQKGL